MNSVAVSLRGGSIWRSSHARDSALRTWETSWRARKGVGEDSGESRAFDALRTVARSTLRSAQRTLSTLRALRGTLFCCNHFTQYLDDVARTSDQVSKMRLIEQHSGFRMDGIGN